MQVCIIEMNHQIGACLQIGRCGTCAVSFFFTAKAKPLKEARLASAVSNVPVPYILLSFSQDRKYHTQDQHSSQQEVQVASYCATDKSF